MSEQNLFLEHQHPTSRRLSVLEDDGTSIWLYLTDVDSRKPVADAWVCNRIPAPTIKEIQAYRGGPPPVAIGYVSDKALCETPLDSEWSFLWSPDGESVAVLEDGEPVACIMAGERKGYSRELIKDGPWGSTWSDELYERVFGVS